MRLHNFPLWFFIGLFFFKTAYGFEETHFDLGALSLSGILVQGGFVKGSAPAGSRISFNGYPVRINDRGRFILGFGRDAKAKILLTVIYPNQQIVRYTIKIAKRTYDIQRIDKLESKYVSPPAEVLARIKEDTRLILKGRKHDTRLDDFDQQWIWHVTGRISGVFGSQRILNGKPRRPHFGIDIAANAGTPFKSPNGGVVRVAHPDMYYSGGTVMIDHGHGLFSTFLHMKSIFVKTDDRVNRGDIIGEVGSTGRSSGAHLDWRINWFNKRLDAGLFAPPMPQ